MEGCFGLVLVVVKPVRGCCVSHTIARPGVNACSVPEGLETSPQVYLGAAQTPVTFVAGSHLHDRSRAGLGSLGGNNERPVSNLQALRALGLGGSESHIQAEP